MAVLLQDGALIVVGWVHDSAQVARGFAVLRKSGGLLKKGFNAVHRFDGVMHFAAASLVGESM